MLERIAPEGFQSAVAAPFGHRILLCVGQGRLALTREPPRPANSVYYK